jgi:hypothetical protein
MKRFIPYFITSFLISCCLSFTSLASVNKSVTDTLKKTENEYAKITGSGSITQKGLFLIHKNKNDLYFEIPFHLLNRDFLVVNKIQKAPKALNDAGVNKGINYENKMVRFELNKDEKKLMIRGAEPLPEYPEGDAIGLSVRENFISPLIEHLPVEAYNKDSSAVVVKVNNIYDGTETSINNVFNQINIGTSAIKDLSIIRATKAFDDKIVVTSELTTKVTEGSKSIYISVEVSSSLLILPEKPMAGRFESNKVGYFTTPRTFFSDKQQQIEKQQLITRWRLEPRPEDVQAYLKGELVEPAKPILFYMDATTPPQWRKYIKEGVENWQVAFERAGFKKAIRALELPDSLRSDTDGINYSLISYVASPKVNAMGPSIYDPRSGEIINADVIWWHNVMSMLQKWIVVQTGAANPKARELPLPEEMMGEAIRFVACHEVGHSLGLRHNMMGSWAIPTDSLRSKSYTDRMRTNSSSIMDYARYNYVAQPGDGVTHFAPGIGPYDLFAIEYGYRWTGNETPEKDTGMLVDLLNRHQGRMYKYSEAQDSRDVIDPRAQSEDLGDDPIQSSGLGIANLKRIVPHIIEWTTTGEQEQSYEEAGRLYSAVINQWNNYLYHVMANIGGIYMENATVGDGQKRFTFVEKDKQAASIDFLLEEVLSQQDWLFGTALNNYVYPMQNSPDGYVENSPSLVLKNTQSYIFWDILENKRLSRMLENESVNGQRAFSAVELLDKMHKHIFGLTEKKHIPTPMERSLQKGFVDALILSVSKENTTKETRKLDDNQSVAKAPNFNGSYADRTSDAISVKRGELLRIKSLLESARKQTNHVATLYHYDDIVLRIKVALDIH